MRGPFDPSSGSCDYRSLQLAWRRANNVSVTINGRQVVVETVVPARLTGFDEIHVLVPAELRGAGTSTLIVSRMACRAILCRLLLVEQRQHQLRHPHRVRLQLPHRRPLQRFTYTITESHADRDADA